VRVATVRRRNLLRGCRRDAEAVDVGRAAAARVRTSDARDELLTGEAEVLAISGRPLDALGLLDGVDAESPRLRVLAAIPRAASLAMVGRTSEAIAVSQDAFDDHLALGDELAIASPGTHRVNLLFALIQAGRLDEAEERGRPWFDAAVRARMPLGVIWTGVHLARCALAQGRPATAIGWSERACAAIDASGFEGLRPAAYAVRAAAHGIRGESSAAVEYADRVEQLTTGFGFLAAELTLGRAWALAATGDLADARAVLLAVADDGERSGHLPAASWLLHDATRLGADGVAPRLEALAEACDSALVAARAAHATALERDDAAGLVAAADTFEALGARLLAAEASAAAADVRRRRNEQRQAAALDLRTNELAARCEGATTPALVRAETVVPLTDREREVALLAAAGHSSKTIAEHLYLSVRTVDNHLARIYDKLGVSSRAELATAFDREADRR
jgi:DNA-binding CsgD family transcriptional regulator